MHLAQHRDQWQALVNTVINLVFHKRRRISWLAKWLWASQGLCSMEYLVSWNINASYFLDKYFIWFWRSRYRF
jgi:hypothetical protein